MGEVEKRFAYVGHGSSWVSFVTKKNDEHSACLRMMFFLELGVTAWVLKGNTHHFEVWV